MKKILIAFVCLGFNVQLKAAGLVQGYSLTEIGEHVYDANPEGAAKTEAQKIVDKVYDLGVRHVTLTPRALMRDPRGSELLPMTALGERSKERDRYRKLINYIKGKGMTVGIRPIFFVVDSAGRTPVIEMQPDGSQKVWWHGNIQPRDPNAWFESFKTYLDIYMTIAKLGKVEEFTIGAELYSMTVGIEDQWKEYPHGFPGRWLELLRYTKTKLGPTVRVMYDINFTDDKAVGPSVAEFGGELARWRYRIVDLANPAEPNQAKIWSDLVSFWKELDAVGIDMYRSLGADNKDYSKMGLDELSAELQQTSDRYASQIDNALVEIEGTVGQEKIAIFKEVGYRSIAKGFIRPFEYADKSGIPNGMHQAAAYRAFLKSFHLAGFPWYKGVQFWDVSVSEALHGPMDMGFSPLGKPETEREIREAFKK